MSQKVERYGARGGTLHDYATFLYSHATVTATQPISATPATVRLPRSERGVDPAGGPRRLKVGIIGATGYVGGELIRILAIYGPDRTLVLLYAGDKAGDWNRWYRTAIPEAARLYKEYLRDTGQA